MRTSSAIGALLNTLVASLVLVACGGDTFHSGDAGSPGGKGNGGATSDAGAGGGGGTKSDGTGGAANSGGSANGGAGEGGKTGAGGHASGGASGNGSGGSADGGAGGVQSGNGGTSAGGSSATGGKGGKGGGSGGASSTGGRGQGGQATGGAGGGGTSCTSSNDCAAKEVCGFPTQGGCTATGTCFPAPAAVCQAYSPGCACDNTTINVICTGLPNGYVSKPLAHTGMCGGTDPKTFACGTMQCSATSEYCKVSEGGACCNPPSYGCVALPASCASTPTCACLGTGTGGGQCSESGGGVTVTYLYP